MISSSHDARTSLIIHISRPVRLLIKRFSLALLFIIAIFSIFISNNESEFSRFVRAYVSDAAAPITSVMAKPVNALRDIKEAGKSYLFVHSKNAELVEENLKLRKKLIKLVGVSYENESLSRLLSYVKDMEYKYISAKVVGSLSDAFQRSLLINVGESDNVKKGQAVISEYGLVGRIIEVNKLSSRVLLMTDINSNIPVISNKSREHSIMSGNNNENPSLMYLPKDSKIEQGEVLVTSGDGNLFPPDLQIGVVSVAGGGIYKVVPFAKWNKLEYLSVIDYSK